MREHGHPASAAAAAAPDGAAAPRLTDADSTRHSLLLPFVVPEGSFVGHAARPTAPTTPFMAWSIASTRPCDHLRNLSSTPAGTHSQGRAAAPPSQRAVHVAICSRRRHLELSCALQRGTSAMLALLSPADVDRNALRTSSSRGSCCPAHALPARRVCFPCVAYGRIVKPGRPVSNGRKRFE